MPSRWSLLLDVPDPDAVRAEHLFAVVSRWMESDAEHHAPRKPFTLSPLRPAGQPGGHPGGGVAFDVGLLDDGLAPLLLDGARLGVVDGVRLGRQRGRMLPWPGGRPGLLALAEEWDDLARVRPAGREVTISLLSPTTFRSGNRYLPFPLPGLVLGHLRECWSLFAPPDLADLPAPDLDECELAVQHYRLDCVRVPLPNRTAVGSVGEVTVRIGGGSAAMAAVGRWLALLPYAAVGAETRHGFGQAEVVTADAAGRHDRPVRRSARKPVR